jgi:Cys-tRNA(Pro)/Cys-tRNA(Cys) deacylase
LTATNAARILGAAGIRFDAREYGVADGKISGAAVAAKIGVEPERVFKTLVTAGRDTGLNVFVLPCCAELNLKKAAQAAGDKYIEMIKTHELEPRTGYVRGGCSPVGMKKLYPTFIDDTASLYDTIYVSGGRVGLQLGIAPADLARVTRAVFSDLF